MNAKDSKRTDELLSALSPVAEADLEPVADSHEWRLLREEITTSPLEERGDAVASRRRVRLPRLNAPRLTVAAALAAAAAVVVTALPGASDDSGSAKAAVKFKTQGNYIVADIRDPLAAQDELNAAFEAEGLDISLTLVPASPSIVGTVVMIGESEPGITAFGDGDCVTGGGGCSIGLRIPRDYTGQAEVSLGRPAQDGERYVSTTTAFAPGEALHCKGAPGSTVGELLPTLERTYATIEWRGGGVLDAAPPVGHIVTDVDPISADSVIVNTREQPVRNPDPAYKDYLASLEAGC